MPVYQKTSAENGVVRNFTIMRQRAFAAILNFLYDKLWICGSILWIFKNTARKYPFFVRNPFFHDKIKQLCSRAAASLLFLG